MKRMLYGFAIAGLLAAAAPAQEIDQLDVCLTCHDDVEQQLKAPMSHPPAQDGECTACHNPHVSRFEGLLQERPGPLCLECHTELQEELSGEFLHGPVAQGRCAECHQPHGGEHESLLKAPVPDLCATCHSQVTAWRHMETQHNPFRREKCNICHLSHGASYHALGKRPTQEACLLCHRNMEKLQPAHGGYWMEKANCIYCHNPHASERPGLFSGKLHPPFEDGDCGICHESATSDEPFALQEVETDLCGECHDEKVEAVREAPFPHLGLGEKGCTACHDPHAGVDTQMRAPTMKVCLTCHDPGGSSSGEEGRFKTHAEDLDCQTCHNPHGGSQPRLLNEDPITLCGGCHEHQHAVTHPMGETTRDPRNGQPMSCLSCHGIHDAPYPKYLHLSGERDLCLSCHTELARRR